MLNVPHFGIDSHLYACEFLALLYGGVVAVVEAVALAGDERRVREDYRGRHVQHTSHGHGVLESRRIQRHELGARVCETGGATECQLEGLLQKKATKDHKVVAVAVLGLHDVCRGQACLVHEEDVIGLAQGVVGIVVLQLALPHCVDEVGFLVVGSLFQQGAVFEIFAVCAVLLALGVKLAFLVGLWLDGGNAYGSRETISVWTWMGRELGREFRLTSWYRDPERPL